MSGDIHFDIVGRLGVITLDRSKALNALTEAMVIAFTDQLMQWRLDDRVSAIVVRAAPGRAFCAGGDIRHVAEAVVQSGVEAVQPFFRAEYRMNWRIHAFPKPFIALIDGIVMGGGVGISVHGRHRVVTENAMFAMPETGIGMFPDVGGSYFLPRLPARLGYYLGLSGRRLRGADCVSAGIATDYVPSSSLADLFDRLAAVTDGDYASVIAEAAEPAPDLSALLSTSQELFAPGPLDANLARLAELDPDMGAEIGQKSPFALAVTKEQLDRGADLDFQGCMAMEYDIVSKVLGFPDFVEGVRALLIDKDKSPVWQYARVADVPKSQVAACFEPLPKALKFDWTKDD